MLPSVDSFRLTVNSSSGSSAQLRFRQHLYAVLRCSPPRCLSQNVQLFYLVQMWPAIKVPDSNSTTRHRSQPTMQRAAGQVVYNTHTHTSAQQQAESLPYSFAVAAATAAADTSAATSFYFVYEIQLKSAKKKYRGQQRVRESEQASEREEKETK